MVHWSWLQAAWEWLAASVCRRMCCCARTPLSTSSCRRCRRRGSGCARRVLRGARPVPGRPPPPATACSSATAWPWLASRPSGRQAGQACTCGAAAALLCRLGCILLPPRCCALCCFAVHHAGARAGGNLSCAERAVWLPASAGRRWGAGVHVPLVLRTGGNPHGAPGARLWLQLMPCVRAAHRAQHLLLNSHACPHTPDSTRACSS